MSWSTPNNFIPNVSNRYSWNSVASDATGQYLIVTDDNDYLFTSTNFGNSWNAHFGINNSDGIRSVASDSTGQYLIAASNTPYAGVILSNDYGVTWYVPAFFTSLNTQTVQSAYNGVASNSTGSVLVATMNDGYTYTSIDYGNNWTQSSTQINAWSVATDTTGTLIMSFSSDGVFICTDSVGANWSIISNMSTYAPFNPWTIKIKQNGTAIIIGSQNANYIVTTPSATVSSWLSSTSYNNFSDNFYYNFDSTDDLTVIVGTANNGVYYSTNGAETPFAAVSALHFQFNGCAINESGSQIVAVSNTNNNSIYVSSTQGVSWFQSRINTPINNWYAVTTNSDGTYLTAFSGNNNSPAYSSSNSGYSWYQSIFYNNGNISQFGIQNAASSGNGQYVYVTTSANSNQIYYSSNYGVSYYNSSPSTYFSGNGFNNGASIATSYSGQYVIAVDNSAVYISNDYGVSFSQIGYFDNNYNYYSVAFGQDSTGTNVLVSSDQGIFYSNDYGINWTLVNNTLLAVRKIAACSDGLTFYAANNSCNKGNSYGGIWKTTDAGQTWVSLNNGSTDIDSFPTISSPITCACSLDGTIVVGCNNDSVTGRGGGVENGIKNSMYLSTDSGNTWQIQLISDRAQYSSCAVSKPPDSSFEILLVGNNGPLQTYYQPPPPPPSPPPSMFGDGHFIGDAMFH